MIKTKKARGFTLIEMLAAIVSFGILSSAIVATMSIANRYWQSGNSGNDAKEGARYALQTMAAELSQGIIDPDPGLGYLTISPPIALLAPPGNAPTAILSPNANPAQQTTNTLVFTEPNPNTPYWVAVTTNQTSTPSFYQKIQYQVTGNILYRSGVQGTSTGITVIPPMPVAMIPKGTLSMTTSYRTPYIVLLSVTAKGKTGPAYTLSTEVFIPGSVGN